MTDLVTRSDADGVASIDFNRPDRRNALIGPMFDQLADHLDSIDGDDSIGAVMLGGAGGAFCSGVDLDAYNADPPPSWLPTAFDSSRRAHVALANCAVPVVVALERYAINGGAAFALAGDFIVVGQGAWLQVGEVRQGLPAPMNVAWLTARHPPATVLRVVLSGDRIGADELHRIGMAHEIVSDDTVRDRAHDLARTLSANPPAASRALKRAVSSLAGMEHPDEWFERVQDLLPIGERFRPNRQH